MQSTFKSLGVECFRFPLKKIKNKHSTYSIAQITLKSPGDASNIFYIGIQRIRFPIREHRTTL